MKFNQNDAAKLGLSVGGKGNTALVHPVHGFGGRRLYIDGGIPGVPGPLIHLSGFHHAEAEALGSIPNPDGKYSGRITGFLPATTENLARATKVLLSADSPAYEAPNSRRTAGIPIDVFFAKAAEKL